MKRTIFILLICVFVFSGCGIKNKNINIEDGNYQIDTENSRVEWFSKRFVMPGSHHGTVNISEGILEIEDDNVKTGEFLFDMTSIISEDLVHTKKMKTNLENHLKSADFFYAVKYPTVNFEITNVKILDNLKCKITGDLTIKDKTNPIEFEANIFENDNGKLIGEAEFAIDRTLWNLKYDSGKFFASLGNQAIDDMIKFKLKVITK